MEHSRLTVGSEIKQRSMNGDQFQIKIRKTFISYLLPHSIPKGTSSSETSITAELIIVITHRPRRPINRRKRQVLHVRVPKVAKCTKSPLVSQPAFLFVIRISSLILSPFSQVLE